MYLGMYTSIQRVPGMGSEPGIFCFLIYLAAPHLPILISCHMYTSGLPHVFLKLKKSQFEKFRRVLLWKMRVHFEVIGYIFTVLVCCTKKIWQPWHTNPLTTGLHNFIVLNRHNFCEEKRFITYDIFYI
jgi:hypothetical protein